MSRVDQAAVGELLAAKVDAKIIPGAVVRAQLATGAQVQWTVGQADTVASRAMLPETLFDLASLTKVVSTTTLVLSLIGSGELTLERPLQAVLPDSLAAAASPVTIADLLTHTSGLPATIDLETELAAGVAPRDAILAATPVRGPQERVVYSDIGFMLLGMVVEAVTAQPLRDSFAEIVTRPLGMASTRFGPVPAAAVAATELDANGVPWCGTVHDENTRAMGGVAGHAGLFSTAGDIGRFARWWLSEDDEIVPVSLRRDALMCRTDGADGRRGLGWVSRGDGFDFLVGWPADAVSHSGFTGTSIALDPGSGSWVVALTNAVHYGRAKEKIRSFRRDLHAALNPAAEPTAAV